MWNNLFLGGRAHNFRDAHDHFLQEFQWGESQLYVRTSKYLLTIVVKIQFLLHVKKKGGQYVFLGDITCWKEKHR